VGSAADAGLEIQLSIVTDLNIAVPPSQVMHLWYDRQAPILGARVTPPYRQNQNCERPVVARPPDVALYARRIRPSRSQADYVNRIASQIMSQSQLIIADVIAANRTR
jgi:hypothetical protein